MLDARFIRENREQVIEALKARKATWDFDLFTELDEKRRSLISQTEQLQARRNSSSKEIGRLMKAGDKDAAEQAKEQVRDINAQIEQLDGERTQVEQQFHDLLLHIPNMPGENCPFGESEDDNPEVRRWGTPREFDFEMKPHWDLGPSLGIID
ncbi:MAG: serine--tRNA ligase, partial [Coriobacteriales bacterium]